MSEYEGSTILITGGAGFIGSWLCEYLLNEGASVVSVDNLSTGSWNNIRHLKNNINFMHITKDVESKDIISDLELMGFDYIFHFASLASPIDFPFFPIKILDCNTIGTRNMLDLARRGDSVFVFASSSEVYGDPEITPVSENYWGNCNPVGVRSCYDQGKRTGEAYCKAFQKKYGVDTRICRIFNTYGERMPKDGRVMPTFIDCALKNEPITIFGNGEQTRCFLYVDDLINGIITILSNPRTSGIPVNIGSVNEITINKLAEKIIEITDSTSEVIYKDLPSDDPKQRKPDVSRIEKLGWQAFVDLDDGIRRVISTWK